MKIKSEGYTLTGVFGTDYIKIEPSPEGASVTIKLDGMMAFTWTLDEADEFQMALERAVSLGRSVQAQNEADES